MQFFVRLIGLWLLAASVFAAIETYDFQNDDQRARYRQLAEELRCPKCQNQNLADSDSQIAADLRRELHRLLLEGQSNEQIVDFMRERYGDFVMYRPPLQNNTLLLWLGPPALLLLVAAALWWSRRHAVVSGSDPEGQTRDAPVSSMSGSDPQGLTPRFVNALSVLAIVLVAVLSLYLYHSLGAAQALRITEAGTRLFSGQVPAAESAQAQEELLAELDAWLARHPDQEKFLYMRARLLAEGGAWQRAAGDYQQLLARFPDQDNLLAEYAQVLFLQNDRVLTTDAAAFLDQALQLNPHNVTALGLLGMQAFEKQDYRKAVSLWQRLLAGLPPGSPQAETIASGIASAKSKGNLVDADVQAAVADIRLSVQVVVDAAAQAKADEPVFVLLRAVNGPRMPLAAVKTTVAALKQPVLLDTATSPMRGQVDLASVTAFEVVARLSRSGQPMAASGDWEARSASLAAGKLPSALTLTIDKAVP